MGLMNVLMTCWKSLTESSSTAPRIHLAYFAISFPPIVLRSAALRISENAE